MKKGKFIVIYHPRELLYVIYTVCLGDTLQQTRSVKGVDA